MPNISENNLRLDLYILMNNTDISRNFIAIAIKNGFAKVNNIIITKTSYRVKSNDIVFFDKKSAVESNIKEDFENVISKKSEIDIIYEDEDLLVINKSSGIATHPSHGNLENTLLNAVHYYLHNDSKSKLGLRKHMIHRLDKDTSGLILFAKSDKMLWWMHKQFAERKVIKKYYALSFSSKFLKDEDHIILSGYIERSRRESRTYLFSAKYGKWTQTDFIIKKNYTSNLKGATQKLILVDCLPKTGRTHQIRVHLKQLGLPIWSDILYSSEKQLLYSQRYCEERDIKPRLFLHAYFLEFISYTGKLYKFEIPLRNELIEILKTFKVNE